MNVLVTQAIPVAARITDVPISTNVLATLVALVALAPHRMWVVMNARATQVIPAVGPIVRVPKLMSVCRIPAKTEVHALTVSIAIPVIVP